MKLNDQAAKPALPESAFLPVETLSARRNVKWSQYEPDVLPSFVAEMDFAVAEPIQRAIERIVREQDYGYPKRKGFERPENEMAAAYARRVERLYGWAIDPADVFPVADLVQATFAIVQAFSEEGDGVILQVPAYSPFFEAIRATRRRVVEHRMRDEGTRYGLDMDELAKLAKTARVLTICNPQNPTGRVFTRAELEAMARIAIENDLVIMADEIHSDLVYPGSRHIPIASLGPEVAARTITTNSPTKGFNIPGLRCAVMHFGGAALKERFTKRIARKTLGQVNVFGMDAAVAAWTEGQPWLDGVVAHLERARDRVMAVLAKEMPAIRCHAPEASYLAWLDCRGLNLNTTAGSFFLENARVGFSAGEGFGSDGEQFVRLNFATSNAILEQILERMAGATRRLAA
jgi:cystathionine beta-lyase